MSQSANTTQPQDTAHQSMMGRSSGIRRQLSQVSIAEIAQTYGTPTYVYDVEVIRSRIEQLRSFDVIRYAMKANSNLAILDLMRQANVVVDSVSAGELLRALAAGYQPSGSPHPIVYTADVFDEEALQLIAEHSVHCNVGSIDMIEQLAERVGPTDVTVRINPGFGHGHSQKTNTGGPQSKHGIWHEQVPELLSVAEQAGVTISGLHMHIGSGTDFEHLSQVCGAMKQIAKSIGPSLDTISAGGGLPIPYHDDDVEIDVERYHQLWESTKQAISVELGRPLILEIEPGRFLTAESGFLVTEIRAIKQMGDNLFYLLDTGFNALARPILYGAYHPMSICPRQENDPDSVVEVVVGGPLCESGDIFTQSEGGTVTRISLPEARVGDYLIIECAGAYGAVMASNYNSKPLPAEVIVDGRQHDLIRRRQASGDVFANEVIPQRPLS